MNTLRASVLEISETMAAVVGDDGGELGSVFGLLALRGQRSLQASAAFLLVFLVLPSAPSPFLEHFGEHAGLAATLVSEPASCSWLAVASSSSCSWQHSCPVGGHVCSAPSSWALQKELGQSWQKASEFFPQTSQWCQGQSQRPVGGTTTMSRFNS